MQVVFDERYMCTKFGENGLFSSGDFAPNFLHPKMAKIPFRTMDYSPWSSKNLINQNQLKKIMQVRIDVTCMHTNFGGCGFSSSGKIATFKNG